MMSGSERHYQDDDHEPLEEVEEGEPWLVSYADMMTLLFGFFVLMYTFASAKVDETSADWVKVKKELVAFFGGEGKIEKDLKESGDTKDLFSPNVGVSSDSQSGSKRDSKGVFDDAKSDKKIDKSENEESAGGTYVGPGTDLTQSQIGSLLNLRKLVDSENSLELIISSQKLFSGDGVVLHPHGDEAIHQVCQRISSLKKPFFLGVTAFSQSESDSTDNKKSPTGKLTAKPLRISDKPLAPADKSIARARAVLNKLSTCTSAQSKGSRMSAMGVGYVPLPQHLKGVLQSGVIIRINVALDY